MLAVGMGAAIGAWLRWWLGSALNAVFPTIPMGTLAANLIGGYLVGIAVALFTLHTHIPPEVRLFMITGFLGGLTTFSTFSAEVVTLFSNGQLAWGLAAAAAHLFGSFALTALGIVTVKVLA